MLNGQILNADILKGLLVIPIVQQTRRESKTSHAPKWRIPKEELLTREDQEWFYRYDQAMARAEKTKKYLGPISRR